MMKKMKIVPRKNYVLQYIFDDNHAVGFSRIIAASTDSGLIFRKAKELKRNKGTNSEHIILVFDNFTGELLDRVKFETPNSFVSLGKE